MRRRNDQYQEGESQTIIFSDHMLRENVALLVLLVPRNASQGEGAGTQGPPVLVANTHLLFNPKRGDIKVCQRVVCLTSSV